MEAWKIHAMNADQITTTPNISRVLYARSNFRFYCVGELLLRISSKEARYYNYFRIMVQNADQNIANVNIVTMES